MGTVTNGGPRWDRFFCAVAMVAFFTAVGALPGVLSSAVPLVVILGLVGGIVGVLIVRAIIADSGGDIFHYPARRG